MALYIVYLIYCLAFFKLCQSGNPASHRITAAEHRRRREKLLPSVCVCFAMHAVPRRRTRRRQCKGRASPPSPASLASLKGSTPTSSASVSVSASETGVIDCVVSPHPTPCQKSVCGNVSSLDEAVTESSRDAERLSEQDQVPPGGHRLGALAVGDSTLLLLPVSLKAVERAWGWVGHHFRFLLCTGGGGHRCRGCLSLLPQCSCLPTLTSTKH